MAFFTLRLPDELASRFDAAAEPSGGRSAALRALIAAAAGQPAASATPPRSAGRRRRIELRFSDAELSIIDRRAAERGMSRSDWIVAAAMARASVSAPPPRDLQGALVDAWRQLKRIGINLNQAVHAVNSAAMEGSQMDLREEAARIAPFRDEVAEQIAAIKRSLGGDHSYWRAEA